MHKRIAAAILWFLTGWTAGSFLTFTVGVSPVLGPILGGVAAGLFAGDPGRIVWVRRPAPAAPKTSVPERV